MTTVGVPGPFGVSTARFHSPATSAEAAAAAGVVTINAPASSATKMIASLPALSMFSPWDMHSNSTLDPSIIHPPVQEENRFVLVLKFRLQGSSAGGWLVFRLRS